MIDGNGVTRRRFLRGSVGLTAAWELQRAAWALGLGQEVPVCNVAAEQEVGPYYVADEMVRSDIREGKPGVPLTLRLAVMDARRCKPLVNAAIDIWHCDAMGLYAGFTKVNPMGFGPGGPGGHGGPSGPDGPSGPPPGFDPQHPGFDPQHPGNRPGPPEGLGPPPPMKTTDALTFLRGIQFTDAGGRVEFQTVFPGFYMGRTNHIHFKVREGGSVVPRAGSATGTTYGAGHTAHVGQVFFPEETAATLMRQAPYARHEIHRTTQAEDGIFEEQHGAASIARLRTVKQPGTDAGYVAELIVAVDPAATPAAVGIGGHRPPPRR